MNKTIALFLTFVLLLTCLTACVTKNPSLESSTPTDPSETEYVPGVAENDLESNPFDETVESTDGTVIDPTEPSANATEATEPSVNATEATEPSANATEPTDNTEATEESTVPTEGDNNPTEDTTPSPSEGDNEGTLSANAEAYAAYLAMSGEEQTAFINTFESPIAFMEWLAIAKAEYEAQNPGIDVGDGNIDIGGNG